MADHDLTCTTCGVVEDLLSTSLEQAVARMRRFFIAHADCAVAVDVTTPGRRHDALLPRA